MLTRLSLIPKGQFCDPSRPLHPHRACIIAQATILYAHKKGKEEIEMVERGIAEITRAPI